MSAGSRPVIIKAEGRITFLKTNNISWIEADDKYVHLHSGKEHADGAANFGPMEAQPDEISADPNWRSKRYWRRFRGPGSRGKDRAAGNGLARRLWRLV